MPYSVLMPIFSDRILHGGARGLGILMGATGIGALGGAMALAVRSGIKGLGKVVGYASAGFGSGLILFSLSRSFLLSALILIPVGFSFMIQMAASNTLIQTIVPDHLRGRVMAVHVMMFIGMAPFGSFLAGAIAAKVGAPLTIGVGAAICIVGAGVFLARLPGLQLVSRGGVQTHMDEN
jgi:MFS family permease